ncbi:MAG: hypothetical protein RJA95_195 [Verrucomicrobiota bacterium]|jgi:hypothetical protein
MLRLILALLTLALPAVHAQPKKETTPVAAPLPKPVPAKDAAAVKFERFELKDAKLLSVLQVIRAKAYHQGELIDMVLTDPKGELEGRQISLSLKNVTVGELMQHLSVLADFKYTIKGDTVTVEPK